MHATKIWFSNFLISCEAVFLQKHRVGNVWTRNFLER